MTRQLMKLQYLTTCKPSNPTANRSPKEAAARPRAGSSEPETRPTNKVGTLATCKIANIQQSWASIALEGIQT